MRKTLITNLAIITITGLSLTAIADDAKNTKSILDSNLLQGKFSGNFGAYSDYKFRGISQTMQSPSAQGNLEFLSNSGVKVGFFGSNVDFGNSSDASSEMDLYTSFNKSFDKLSTETGFIYYGYPGAKSANNYDYSELYEIVGYDFEVIKISGSFNYSPNFLADSGTAYYPKFTVTVPITKEISLDTSIGHQWVNNNVKYGVPDYTDYTLGIAYSLNDFTLRAAYIGTNLNSQKCASDLCRNGVILSLAKSF